ncbi:ABC transporter permease subunit [Sporomusa malonica]|uniref:Monosaccharide ABC transporter membrane protein, CUT2 family (TC 3.A.1.2.-) n=1 Tax=Sporomusa malonica TaxID=112901 RepID=A0A1W2E0W2_9FIRM|nr:ABC transporter [Sporomusa malonica]SMD02688.1 monosaccharide ABC transporter membrane protein, CUT2 family (TC 3.A.1.2.-) [Sporomusa malonica]
MELWQKVTNKYGYPKVCITLFLVVLITLAFLQKQNVAAMFGDSLVRTAMNGILVLAMVPSIMSGTGLNFGLSLGIITGLLAGCISIEMDMRGMSAFMWAVIISIPLSAAMGYGYGWILNKVKGDEMTVGTYMGFAMVSLMSIGWLLIPFKSPEMVWAIGGNGLRTTIALSGRFAKVLDDFMAIPFFGSKIPTGAILFFAIFCLLMWLFMRSKTGIAMMAAGDNPSFAVASGIDVDRQRMIGTVISTILGGIGMLVYAQSFGFLQLYQAPLMMPFAATAAILIGGASDKKATIAHVVAGTILFQTLLTISMPVINSAVNVGNLSEVTRIIVSNGVILYALTKVGGYH